MRDRRKAVGDVGFHHPGPAPEGLIQQDLQGVVRRALRAEPKAARQKTGLKDRLEHDLRRRLHDPVTDSRNRQRAPLRPARLRDKHPAGGQRAVAAIPQIRGQLIKQPVHAVLLNHGQSGPVNARRAAVTAHLLPRPLQDIPAVDLVEQRMEPPPGIGLGRPVKRMLQGADPVPTDSRQGGPSRNGTHQPLP